MNDLISRQAAIDALERIFDRCEEIEAHMPKGDPDRVGYKMYPDWLTVWKYLHQVPSAEPEQRWIPVSERLPEPNTRCLVTTEDGYVDVDDYYVYGWDDNCDTVIAWMPMPTPCKEDSKCQK